MNFKIYNLLFSLMSLLLVVGSSFVTFDGNGGVNVSFLHEVHHSEHSGDCGSTDVCYDNQSACNDIAIDFSSIISTGLSQLNLLAPTTQDPFFTFSTQRADRYLSNLYVTQIPSQILRNLSTVVLTT